MTVLANSGRASDHAVGLAAISRHQGVWSHDPNLRLDIAADGRFQGWMQNNLGMGASRLARRPLTGQFTGHTAVFSRVAGQVQFASGFVPDITGYPGAFLGAGGGGHWQNDLPMLNDPTCASFEIPVTHAHAAGFQQWFNNASGGITTYSLRGGDAERTFNCVLAAVTVVVNYLSELGNYEAHVQQLLTVNDSSQGHFMHSILGGFPIRARL